MAVGSTARSLAHPEFADLESVILARANTPVRSETLGHTLAMSARLRNSNDAALCQTAVEIDARKLYEAEYATSTVALMAYELKITPGLAGAYLALGQKLKDHAGLRSAFAFGLLSMEQVKLIVKGAELDPSAYEALLDCARNDSLSALERLVRAIEVAKAPPKDEKEAAKRASFKLKPKDGFGYSASGYLTNEQVARLKAALEPETNRIAKAKLKAGTFISQNHCRAEALSKLAAFGNGRTQRTHVSVVVDFEALKRGEVHFGDLAEIPGIGSLTLDRIKQLLERARLNIVVKGKDETVDRYRPSQHLRRKMRVHSRGVCEILGCDHTGHLEGDHNHEARDGGETSADNLIEICSGHHRMKTIFRLKLVGLRGRRRFVRLGPNEMGGGSRAGP